MKTIMVVLMLASASVVWGDNCYILDGFPADQARCVAQAQNQQNIMDKTQQQFQAQNAIDAQAMNNAMLLDQLRENVKKGVYVDPNSLPEQAPMKQ